MNKTICLVAAASVLLVAQTASAQLQPAPAPPQGYIGPQLPPGYEFNQGFMIGFGLGLSSASCDNCDTDTSVGLDFNVGGFINPRLAIMYDFAAWADAENDATLVISSNTAAAQYWVAPNAWVKGGVGLSHVELDFGDGGSFSDSGLAATGAAGFEVMQMGNFVIDISGRLGLLDFEGGSITLINAVVGARWK